MALSDTTIKAAKPKDKPYKLTDKWGMYLLVDTKGRKYFRFDYRFKGKRKTLALGVYPATSLKMAGGERDKARSQIAEGIDPGLSRKQTKINEKTEKERELHIALGIPIAGTFEALAREWLDKKYRQEVEPATLAKTTRQLELHVFPSIGAIGLSELKSADILKVLKRVSAQDKIETAHRLRTRINNVFNYAIIHGLTDYNPVLPLAGALPSIQVTHRAAITEPVRVGQLMRDIYTYEGTLVVQCALKLSALLMVRPGELRQAEWKDFYLSEREWRYFVTKTKTEHTVPLPNQAIKILEQIRELSGGGRYVFPSARNDGRPLSENGTRQALRGMGYGNEDITPHGFRTIASTLLNEQGWSPDAIERQLAHAPRDQVRAAYNRAQYLDERRRMMQSWADYLDGLRSGAKIIPFEKAGN